MIIYHCSILHISKLLKQGKCTLVNSKEWAVFKLFNCYSAPKKNAPQCTATSFPTAVGSFQEDISADNSADNSAKHLHTHTCTDNSVAHLDRDTDNSAAIIIEFPTSRRLIERSGLVRHRPNLCHPYIHYRRHHYHCHHHQQIYFLPLSRLNGG